MEKCFGASDSCHGRILHYVDFGATVNQQLITIYPEDFSALQPERSVRNIELLELYSASSHSNPIKSPGSLKPNDLITSTSRFTSVSIIYTDVGHYTLFSSPS